MKNEEIRATRGMKDKRPGVRGHPWPIRKCKFRRARDLANTGALFARATAPNRIISLLGRRGARLGRAIRVILKYEETEIKTALFRPAPFLSPRGPLALITGLFARAISEPFEADRLFIGVFAEGRLVCNAPEYFGK